MRTIYLGSAICRMNGRGGVVMPPEFRRTANCQKNISQLVVGLHRTSKCLVVCQESFLTKQHDNSFEYRNRLAPDQLIEHHDRLRRAYGFVDYFTMDHKGSVNIPPLMCQLAGLGESLFLIAAGETFEIWDLEQLMATGPADLKLLASHMTNDKSCKEAGNEKDEFAVPHARSLSGRAGNHIGPGLRIQ